MKLLFDQNLSPKLVKSLADLFPHSGHVYSMRGWIARATIKSGNTPG
jgi:predicted nuclease of predicted toxin-antitoxin system